MTSSTDKAAVWSPLPTISTAEADNFLEQDLLRSCTAVAASERPMCLEHERELVDQGDGLSVSYAERLIDVSGRRSPRPAR